MSAAIQLLIVVVPARDEERALPRCLDAIDAAIVELRRAGDSEHGSVPHVRVVIVLDRCVDNTRAIAEARAGVETVVSTAGQVGRARALGVEAVLLSTDVAADRIWIANTDADSAVPHDWLRHQLAAAQAGDVALIGAVRPDSEGLDDSRLSSYLADHPLRDDHDNVHGANLGVRADAYLAVGGFASVATGEDVRLVDALVARGLRLRSTSHGAVVTSSRLVGRAPDGYAAALHTSAV
ncbi:glycosyltransferase family 2 protein [Agreia sp. COWG]|uniref:glycosyltransferase n=1 Tax=Agreia sp. COWG TaxID=2773266 RepID=UPI001927BE52|nr:glycosyltransferase [Agreia sp. COWG]CAD6003227.1 Glyco_trans_2-like domain-containing protein [Agreia sp. COWG]